MNRSQKSDFVADVNTVAQSILDQEYDVSDQGAEYFAGVVTPENIGYLGFNTNSSFIIAAFYRKTEIINQDDPDFQTSESSHVKVRFYIQPEFDYTDNMSVKDAVQSARKQTKDKTPDGSAYHKAHRIQSLEDGTKEFLDTQF